MKMAYGCLIKMAKKSEEEEEDKNNPEKKGRGSDLWHILYERKKNESGTGQYIHHEGILV